MIRMVFDLKRRTTSFDRREDGVSYLDLVNKGVVEQLKEESVGGYTTLLVTE